MATTQGSARSEPIVIPPTQEHTATVIFVHGMGQTNESWLLIIRPIVDRLPGVKWILPQAPSLSVTYSQGRVRPSWFDIVSLPPCNCYDEHGIATSVAALEDLIITEVRRGTPSSKTVLVGFSQGAALSLMTALTTLHELGGVASLSGWIPRQSRQAMQQLEPSLPVFWSHGRADEEVPLSYGEEATSFLRDGLRLPVDKVAFKTYDGLEHTVDDAVISDLTAWLARILV
ncbi:Phospholipase/carboxylesterase [Daedaleopsis nitida]|nr:Phospholipase/carboxylesterase [Daedaleopsis nitida]